MIHALQVVTADSIEDIRSIPKSLRGKVQVLLLSSMREYVFRSLSSDEDDGVNVLAPDPSVGSCCLDSGRWIIVPCCDDGSSSSAAIPEIHYVNKEDGNVGLGAMAPIAGMAITLTLAQDSDVTIDLSADFSITSFSFITCRLTVDGVDYDFTPLL